jgi:plastocyanin
VKTVGKEITVSVKYQMSPISKLASRIFVILLVLNVDAVAVDETIPHPIDERGLLTWVSVKTMRLFRKVEVLEIKDLTIQKSEMTIEPGTVIVFENQDKTSNHRIIIPPASSNDILTDVGSPVIKPGELWGAEFLDPGIYPFHCTLHPDGEHGVISVVSPH